MPAKPTQPSLEDALKRLDALVEEMESGELQLETLIERFEEGIALTRSCQARLDQAETRIQTIIREADGSVKLEDFEQ
ncbi:MAG: exodeoxyribonuclease VII small subunit [Chthoniobacterales bacterium]